MLYRQILRPMLFRLAGGDPERMHERVLGGLGTISHSAALTKALSLAASLAGAIPREEQLEAFGLRFPHPVGLAAGFDKNAVAIPALAALGFSFVEIGTVTRDGQPGNPRPRLFRLPQDEALINRMGFNNDGAEAVARHLCRVIPARVPIGVSLGKSRSTPMEDAVHDYLASLDILYPYGDYFAVNVSSPNTPGLRALQEGERLNSLLEALTARLAALAALETPFRPRPKPLLVKIAPDLDDEALDKIVEVCLRRGASGVIAVNTTTSRDGLRTAARAGGAEAGGLSGRPLQSRALAVIRYLHAQCGDRLPIIGCGGIFSADEASRMLDAGAVLLQIYTGFIYEGPLVARRIVRNLRNPDRPYRRKDSESESHAQSQI